MANPRPATRVARPAQHNPLWVRATIMGISVVVALTGCASQSFEHTETVDAPFAVLWEVWTDVPAWPAWDTEMSAAELDGPFEEGARGVVVTSDGEVPIVISRVVERGYTLTFELPLATLNIDRDAPTDEQPLRFTHRFRFEGVMGAGYAAARSGYYEGILPGVMRRLVEIVEERAAVLDDP